MCGLIDLWIAAAAAGKRRPSQVLLATRRQRPRAAVSSDVSFSVPYAVVLFSKKVRSLPSTKKKYLEKATKKKRVERELESGP